MTTKYVAVPARHMIGLELQAGDPSSDDIDKVVRLRRRRPRRRFIKPEFPPVSVLEAGGSCIPADVYMGSGMSYEAGLPTLCDMHERFGVDNETASAFTTGSKDPLPAALASDGEERVRSFCDVHRLALTAEPTAAMETLARLQRERKIGKIFTDNVDNMLCKVNARFIRVRGSGVFNERYGVDFSAPRLLVVGVAADRRQIVKQARSKGLQIVIVNPVHKVSPNVSHLDYLTANDTFFKTTADNFFSKGLSILHG